MNTPRKFDVILFDAAETLFTTRGTVGEIYGEVARKYGSTSSFDQIQSAFQRQFRHAGPLTTDNEKPWWHDVVFRVFEDVGMVRNFDKFFDEVYEEFRDSRGWKLFPETIDVLKELKKQKFKLGVISNFDSRVYSVMKSLKILDYFDTVTLSSETGFAKPHPGIFKAAIKATGVSPSRILYIGDSIGNDVEAGAAAGFHAILIDRNRQHPEIPSIQSLNQVLTHAS